ncbi:MAG: DUF2865 domain-containing protein [Rhizobiales bacterium]|nr:DUF2865 domain-containing protein [Hyphomicrobiales bacterium]
MSVSAREENGTRVRIASDGRGGAVLRAEPLRWRKDGAAVDPIRYYMEPIVRSFSPSAYRRGRPKAAPAIAYSYAPRGGENFRIMDQTGAPRTREAALPKPRTELFRDARSPAPSAVAQQSTRTECVRLCDGYHFPIGRLASLSDLSTHEAMCRAACPDAQVQLFTVRPGQTVESAVSRDRVSYAALPAAFAYRAARSSSCSCKSGVTPARLSIFIDPTLRPGDAVVTEDGAKVFDGSGSWPRKPSDFTDFAASKRLTNADRKKIDSLVGVTYAANLLKPYKVARSDRGTAVAEVVIVRPQTQPQPNQTSIVREVDPSPPAAHARQQRGIVALSGQSRPIHLVERRAIPGFRLR